MHFIDWKSLFWIYFEEVKSPKNHSVISWRNFPVFFLESDDRNWAYVFIKFVFKWNHWCRILLRLYEYQITGNKIYFLYYVDIFTVYNKGWFCHNYFNQNGMNEDIIRVMSVFRMWKTFLINGSFRLYAVKQKMRIETQLSSFCKK